jgi:DNA repair protein RecO (recombination protein O)
MTTHQTVNTEAIVLNRKAFGEADWVMTLYTKASGKLTCVAKGARKMQSSKRAYLELGSEISIQLIQSHGLPILSQATLISSPTEYTAQNTKALFQVLEIIHTLTPEQDPSDDIYMELRHIIRGIHTRTLSHTTISHLLNTIVTLLGYSDLADTPHKSITEYVETIADRPMHAFSYLTVSAK